MTEYLTNFMVVTVLYFIFYVSNEGSSVNFVPTRMCAAAADGSVAMLQQLIRSGADPSCADYDKRTALHIAASEGQHAAVVLLIQCGADVDAR